MSLKDENGANILFIRLNVPESPFATDKMIQDVMSKHKMVWKGHKLEKKNDK